MTRSTLQYEYLTLLYVAMYTRREQCYICTYRQGAGGQGTPVNSTRLPQNHGIQFGPSLAPPSSFSERKGRKKKERPTDEENHLTHKSNYFTPVPVDCAVTACDGLTASQKVWNKCQYYSYGYC